MFTKHVIHCQKISKRQVIAVKIGHFLAQLIKQFLVFSILKNHFSFLPFLKSLYFSGINSLIIPQIPVIQRLAPSEM